MLRRTPIQAHRARVQMASPFQPIQYRFPLGRTGRNVYRNPAVISGVRLVEDFVERGGVIGCRLRHLVDGDLRAAGRMKVLQVNSLTLVQTPIGQSSIRR